MSVYHERQSLRRCAIHSLNNLYQGKVFDVKAVNQICQELSPSSWINPHKSVIGVGNYDVNVLMSAVGKRGHVIKWHDRRKPFSNVRYDLLVGIFINVAPSTIISKMMRSRHWYTLGPIGEEREWYNLDSKLLAPIKLDEPAPYLASLSSNTQVLFVCSPEHEASMYEASPG